MTICIWASLFGTQGSLPGNCPRTACDLGLRLALSTFRFSLVYSVCRRQDKQTNCR